MYLEMVDVLGNAIFVHIFSYLYILISGCLLSETGFYSIYDAVSLKMSNSVKWHMFFW
jgi:hypothetical protein